MGYRKEVLAFQKYVETGEPFICFDTETTGLDCLKCDIIEFSGLKIRKTASGYEKEELDFYINPGYEIDKEITDLTGITTDKVRKEGVTFEEAAKRINDFLGDEPVLIGYNSSFDEHFINALMTKTGNSPISPKMHLDVLKMAKEKTPKPHKLINMAERAGVSEKYRFHASIDDAKATFDVYLYLLPMYGKEEHVTTFEITSISRWQKYSFDRIYISNRQNLAVYYDVNEKTWVLEGDIEDIRERIYEFAKVTTDEELVKKYTTS